MKQLNDKELKELLREPIGEFLTLGYMVCPRCKRYFHHKLEYCGGCGGKIIREKRLPWYLFLQTYRSGGGPWNTFQSFLLEKMELAWRDTWDDKEKGDELMNTYRKARKLQREMTGEK